MKGSHRVYKKNVKLSLRRKILLGYMVTILFLILVGYISYTDSLKVTAKLNQLNDEIIPKLGLVNEIELAVISQQNDERGLLAFGDDKEYSKKIIEKADETDKVIQKALSLADPDDEEVLLKMQAIHKEFTDIEKKIIATYQSGNIDEAKALSFNDGAAKRKELKPLYEDLDKVIQLDLKQIRDGLNNQLKRDRYITLGSILVAIVIAVFMGFFISKKIVDPIYKVVELSKKVAEGDLAVEDVVVKTKDETRELANSFNAMVHQTRELITDVLSSTELVAATSNQLSTNAEEANKATVQVASAIQEVAKGSGEQTRLVNNSVVNVNQVGATIQQITSGEEEQRKNVAVTSEMVSKMATSIDEVVVSAQTVADTAEKTKLNAQKGGEAVDLTIKGMEDIRSKVFESANNIKELGEHSQQIGEIIQVIDDIAEQTNLLALNAAIEAARAGEHGKGFAVVADEVRKLAERSGGATKEIAELITNIQRLTNAAVNSMEQGTSEVEQGTHLALGAGEALKEILTNVEDTYRQVLSISNAAEQISANSQEVVQAVSNVAAITQNNALEMKKLGAAGDEVTSIMDQIAAVTEQSSAASEEVSASTEEMMASVEGIASAAENLATMAQDLKNKANRFKVS